MAHVYVIWLTDPQASCKQACLMYRCCGRLSYSVFINYSPSHCSFVDSLDSLRQFWSNMSLAFLEFWLGWFNLSCIWHPAKFRRPYTFCHRRSRSPIKARIGQWGWGKIETYHWIKLRTCPQIHMLWIRKVKGWWFRSSLITFRYSFSPDALQPESRGAA